MTTETKKPQVGKRAIRKELQKESKEESFHIQVAELGMAIVLNCSPPAIAGCYTEALASCIGILLRSEKGFALIHDSRVISGASFKNVCRSLGDIEYIDFYYNPNFCDLENDPTAVERVIEIISYINEAQKENNFKEISVDPLDPTVVAISEAPHSFVTITRRPTKGGFEISSTIEEKPTSLRCPGGLELRLRINQVNGFFLKPNEMVAGDMHFDGINYYGLPALNKTWSEVLKIMDDYTVIEEQVITPQYGDVHILTVESQKAALDLNKSEYQALAAILAKEAADCALACPFALPVTATLPKYSLALTFGLFSAPSEKTEDKSTMASLTQAAGVGAASGSAQLMTAVGTSPMFATSAATATLSASGDTAISAGVAEATVLKK